MIRNTEGIESHGSCNIYLHELKDIFLCAGTSFTQYWCFDWKIPVRLVCSVSYELKPSAWRTQSINKTDRLYSDNINVDYVFLPWWRTRKESNFKLLPWESHDNECCGKHPHELKHFIHCGWHSKYIQHSLTSYTRYQWKSTNSSPCWQRILTS